MSYGDHQEAVSAALLRLLDINTPEIPDGAAVLATRHQVHLALEERLGGLGGRGQSRARHRVDRTISAAKHPVHVLHSILRELPRPPAAALAPSDVLMGPPPADATESLVLWRTAARHLTLGNADLAASITGLPAQRPATWYLLGDLSTTLEAIVILDERLAKHGHLPAPPHDLYLRARLAAGAVTRIASWRGTDPSPDLARLPTTKASFPDDGPRIRLVRRPEDFAAAQRTLAGFLRPGPIQDAHDPLDGRPGLHTARTIAEGQVRLAEAFATWADHAGETQLAQRFRTRIPNYIELHRSTLRMTELRPTRPILVDLQQSEMTQQLRRHRSPTLSRIALHELDAATHELTVNVGRSLRREGLRRKNILVLDTDSDEPVARPITNTRNRFNLACRTLARDPEMPPQLRAAPRAERHRLTELLSTRPD